MRLLIAVFWMMVIASAPVGAEDRPAAAGEDRRISLELVDVEIEDALRTLADLMHVNIAAAKGVHGRVTLRLRDVSAEDALQSLLSATGNRAERQGGVIIVYPLLDQ